MMGIKPMFLTAEPSLQSLICVLETGSCYVALGDFQFTDNACLYPLVLGLKACITTTTLSSLYILK